MFSFFETVEKLKRREVLNELMSKIPVKLSDSGPTLDKQILRAAIIAELDAVNLYEQMADVVSDSSIREVLLDVAKEEKTHVGEFQAILEEIDEEYEEELETGADEVEEIEGKEDTRDE